MSVFNRTDNKPNETTPPPSPAPSASTVSYAPGSGNQEAAGRCAADDG